MTQFSYPPFGSGNLANPTASIGLTAVNGSATTAMRSDGAPTIDQTAAFAFSGLGATTIADATQSTSTVTGSLKTAGGLGVAKNAFFGGTLTVSGGNVSINGGFSLGVAGTISASGGNPITTTGGGNFNATGNLQLVSDSYISFASGSSPTSGQDTKITRGGAAATLQLGAAAAASPVNQFLQAQPSRPGSDANTAGASLTITPGLGTGNASTATLTLGGVIGNATSTTTAQTSAAGLSIPGVASGQLPGAVVGSAAIATNATDGFLYIPSCAGPPTGTPTAFTGRVPLVYDSTNDQFYVYRGGWKQPKTPAGAAIVNWQ